MLLLLIFSIGVTTGQGLLALNQKEITEHCNEFPFFKQSELHLDDDGDPYYVLASDSIDWFIYFNELGYVNLSLMIPKSNAIYYGWLNEVDATDWNKDSPNHWMQYPTMDSIVIIHCTRYFWNLYDQAYPHPVFEFIVEIKED